MGLHVEQVVHREGIVTATDGRVPAEGEHVLDVELQLVHLPVRQFLDELLQRVHRRHFAPRTIQVKTAAGKIGRIVDPDSGHVRPAGAHPLAQGLQAVISAGIGAG